MTEEEAEQRTGGSNATVPAILIVEDDPASRDLLREVVETSGYEAVVATDGRHALELLVGMKRPPCVILLDMLMPVMDGLAFEEALGDSARNRSIPIVWITAFGSMTRSSRQVGQVLTKPFNVEKLKAILQQHCRET